MMTAVSFGFDTTVQQQQSSSTVYFGWIIPFAKNGDPETITAASTKTLFTISLRHYFTHFEIADRPQGSTQYVSAVSAKYASWRYPMHRWPCPSSPPVRAITKKTRRRDVPPPVYVEDRSHSLKTTAGSIKSRKSIERNNFIPKRSHQA